MYYNNEFNKNQSNMRKMWNTISEIIHKQNNNHISIKKIGIQGKCINDQTEITYIFNDFFINIGPNLTNKANLRDFIAVTGLVFLLKIVNYQFFSLCDLEI